MKRVGAWIMKGQMLDRQATVELLLRARCNHASVMLNDFSKARAATPFKTHDADALIAFADACRAEGIDVSFTTWVMPHDEFVRGMCEQLPDLLAACRVERLYLDAEEPWHRATGSFNRTRAAQTIEREIGEHFELALSAIVYTNEDKTKPLAAICDVYSPQAYAVEEGLDPSRAVSFAVERWSRLFGVPASWSMGLAAYKLPDDPTSYMQPPIDDCRALEIDDVCYWASLQLGQDEDRVAFVAGLRESAEPSSPASGIMPTLDIAAMPSSEYSGFVKRAQALLSSWSFDPGPVDGKPGTKTLTAVQSFQASLGLRQTGIVDGGLWWELLGQ